MLLALHVSPKKRPITGCPSFKRSGVPLCKSSSQNFFSPKVSMSKRNDLFDGLLTIPRPTMLAAPLPVFASTWQAELRRQRMKIRMSFTVTTLKDLPLSHKPSDKDYLLLLSLHALGCAQ